MKLLMLSWEYPPRIIGGLSRHVHGLSNELSKQGVEVHILTCSPTNKTNSIIEKNGVHVHRIEPYHLNTDDFLLWVHHFNEALIEYAFKLEKEVGFDIVHAHDWINAFSARAIKHAFHIPLVVTIHATEFGRNNGLHNNIQKYIGSVEWWLAYESWKVICCSKFMSDDIESFLSLPVDKIRIIPNGIDLNEVEIMDPFFNRQEYASEDESIIFFIGRHVMEKGIEYLIKSIPLILEKNPKTKFIISGKGPLTNNLKQLANNLNVSEKIIFTGYINDNKKNSILRNSQIAVFPSIYEPFGIVALESMAAKVPVVVSDTGGFREIIKNNIDGIKAIPGNEFDLANSITKILLDKNLSYKLKTKGYSKAVKEYSWNKIAYKTISVYSEILNEYNTSSWKNNKFIGGDTFERCNNGRWGRHTS